MRAPVCRAPGPLSLYHLASAQHFPSRHQCASCGIMRTSLCRINFIGAMPGSHSSVQRDTGGDTAERVLVRVRVRGVTLIPRAVRGTPQGAAVVSLDTFNHP